jgi:AraC-like DNA-binding protein
MLPDLWWAGLVASVRLGAPFIQRRSGQNVEVESEAIDLLMRLFDAFPHVIVCVKDIESRYIAVNEAFVTKIGLRRIDQVLGSRAHDLYPHDLAASYDAQDRSLFATGQPSRNQLELISDGRGNSDWYLSSKVLHRIGPDPVVVAVSVPVQLPRGTSGAGGLRSAVELVRTDHARPLRVRDIADAAGMSSDRLERIMRRVLNVTPKQFLLRTRLDHAAMLLVTTDRPIAEIAADCGFFDQSQLTRQFGRHVGLPPNRYRNLALQTTPPATAGRG